MDIRQITTAIEEEFTVAHASRLSGNEGRARVCARRAAGLAIGIYFENQTAEKPTGNAYKLLQWFSEQEEIPEELQRSARRLIVRVTPEYELPHEEDPIDDARSIVSAVLTGAI
jgi:hypothetical protein